MAVGYFEKKKKNSEFMYKPLLYIFNSFIVTVLYWKSIYTFFLHTIIFMINILLTAKTASYDSTDVAILIYIN